MKINPFILTQVRERQNELVLNLEPFDKQKLSEALYSFWGAWEEKLTFFRCYRVTKNEIVAAYYWKTTRTEPDSGRDGLYVVIGFMISDCSFRHFMAYSNTFFAALEKSFGISMDEPVSDALFDRFQGDVNEMKENLLQCCKPDIPIFPDKLLFGERRLQWLFYKYQRRKKQTSDLSYLYIMKNGSDFYARWNVFMNEAFKLLRAQGYGDISSLEKYTINSLVLLKNGDKIPENVTAVKLESYRRVKYLVLS